MQHIADVASLPWLENAFESIARDFGGTLCCSALPKVTLAELIQEVGIRISL